MRAKFGNFDFLRDCQRWTFDAYSPPLEDSTFIFYSLNQPFEVTSRCAAQKTYNPGPSANDASVIFSSEARFTARAVGRDMARMIGMRARADFWTSS